MAYFITGATGFIGGHLVRRLLEREGTIYVLVRKGSEDKIDALREKYGVGKDRIKSVEGDLNKAKCGVTAKSISSLKGKIDHFFHLAAIYDMTLADSESQVRTNVNGTRHAVQLAEAVDAGCLHHTSSIAAAGLFRGYWREDMFEEAENTQHPYFKTKHDSERVVRRECKIPWRVYRPGIVVGDSRTGEMAKIDGPYYFFKLIQKIRKTLPEWVPLLGLEGTWMNIVPVDYVADAMDHIAHLPGLDGKCFHLTDPEPHRVGEILNILARAAHAPRFVMRIDARVFGLIPPGVRTALWNIPPVRNLADTVLHDFGVPPDILKFINYPTRFDCRDAQEVLKGSGIKCPNLEDYAWILWDYWERHLDPELFRDRSLAGAVGGKVVLITGGSSGIGRASAIKLAGAGAKLLLVARTASKLQEVKEDIEAQGGEAYIYPTDLTDETSVKQLVEAVTKDHGGVDVLINNAGRSIRRSISLSYDRFHDFTRCVETNFYAPLRLMLGFLPGMEERRSGHIINISSIGVLVNPPRFAAYVASKSALEAFSRIAQPEFLDKGVRFTVINMPLVRTPMIGPTTFYQHVPTLSPDDAADLVCKAVIYKPKRIATRLGIFGQTITTLAPKIGDIIQNTSYKLFPDTRAARGEKDAQDLPPSTEAVVFATITRGVHW
ncbi:MAG: SDR family oxidoreductase [Desulfatibacillaceae bacterium]